MGKLLTGSFVSLCFASLCDDAYIPEMSDLWEKLENAEMNRVKMEVICDMSSIMRYSLVVTYLSVV